MFMEFSSFNNDVIDIEQIMVCWVENNEGSINIVNLYNCPYTIVLRTFRDNKYIIRYQTKETRDADYKELKNRLIK